MILAKERLRGWSRELRVHNTLFDKYSTQVWGGCVVLLLPSELTLAPETEMNRAESRICPGIFIPWEGFWEIHGLFGQDSIGRELSSRRMRALDDGLLIGVLT